MMDFPYRTQPFAHQRTIFEERGERVADAHFLEMGTAKTKINLDSAANLYLKGKINGLLVIAPNGVQRNWINEEIPIHMSEAVVPTMRCMVWKPTSAGTQKHQKEALALLSHKGLAVFAIGYDAAMTARGRDMVRKFLTKRDVYMALDEAHNIKTPGIKRTKALLAAGRLAKYRRVLTGTPITNAPFDVYTQIKFCYPDFWTTKGLGSFSAFKTFFGIWEKGVKYNPVTQKTEEYPNCVGYQNLTLLHKWLGEVSVRVLKSEVLDLPPKLYATRSFEMSTEQRRLYNQLVNEFTTTMANGVEISAPLAIVRMLRLQQVLSGYLPNETFDEDGYPTGSKVLVPIGDNNPRLDCLEELVDTIPVGHKTIIWAKYNEDVTQILAMLARNKRSAVRYDGLVKDSEKEKNKIAFQFDAEGPEFFVGTPSSGGSGLTLTSAKLMIYYNNSHKLLEREQSEDRVHRAGLKHSIQYIDLFAEGTIDTHIIRCLRQKMNVAAIVNGDRLKEWLTT